MPENKGPIPCIAVVTHGYFLGGGVPRATKFAHQALQDAGFRVKVIDLATSSRDQNSVRLVRPFTWLRGVKLKTGEFSRDVICVGAVFSEFEPMRYRPRKKLTEYLDTFDGILMVSGTPCWAGVLRNTSKPTLLQFATTSDREKGARLVRGWSVVDLIRLFVKPIVSRQDQNAVRVPNVVIPINKEMLEWASNHRGDQKKTVLIYQGIDTNFFIPGSLSHKGEWLVSIGRLDEVRKGWPRLINAYAAYRATNSNPLPLRIIGTGQMSQANVELVSQLHLEDVISVESDLDDSEILTALQGSRIFVQTSYEEGLGLAALEAMACGIPILCTDTDGSREYLDHGINGFFLSQDDEQMSRDFIAGVNQIMSEQGMNLGDNALQLCVAKFSAQLCGQKIALLMKSAIGENGPDNG